MTATSKISFEQATVTSIAPTHFSGAVQAMSQNDLVLSDNPEEQLKELWSKYVNHLDTKGATDTAEELRSQYYSLYREYKQKRMME